MAHNTFVLEVTGHDGKVRPHGLGIGGVPNIDAEGVADHFRKVDHFRGKAKKVRIMHRSSIVRKALSDIHTVKQVELPEVEVHEDANKMDPELDKPSAPTPTPTPIPPAPARKATSLPTVETDAAQK